MYNYCFLALPLNLICLLCPILEVKASKLYISYQDTFSGIVLIEYSSKGEQYYLEGVTFREDSLGDCSLADLQSHFIILNMVSYCDSILTKYPNKNGKSIFDTKHYASEEGDEWHFGGDIYTSHNDDTIYICYRVQFMGYIYSAANDVGCDFNEIVNYPFKYPMILSVHQMKSRKLTQKERVGMGLRRLKMNKFIVGTNTNFIYKF